MTEKRFWCLEEYKRVTSHIIDGRFATTNDWLCNKLNALEEENRRLKERLHQREVAKQRRIDYDEFWSKKIKWSQKNDEHLAWKRVDLE